MAGRKTSYKSEYAAAIESLADNPESIIVRGSVSDTKIAGLLGVSAETVRLWKKPSHGRENQYQADFAAAIKKCQAAIDTGDIKRSMVVKAKGFTSVKVFRAMVADGDKGEKLKVVKKITETVAGDVTAAKLVLNNIDKGDDRWNTAEKQELSGNLKIDGLTQVMQEMDGNGKRLPQG
jgi:hypothetical protein